MASAFPKRNDVPRPATETSRVFLDNSLGQMIDILEEISPLIITPNFASNSLLLDQLNRQPFSRTRQENEKIKQITDELLRIHHQNTFSMSQRTTVNMRIVKLYFLMNELMKHIAPYVSTVAVDECREHGDIETEKLADELQRSILENNQYENPAPISWKNLGEARRLEVTPKTTNNGLSDSLNMMIDRTSKEMEENVEPANRNNKRNVIVLEDEIEQSNLIMSTLRNEEIAPKPNRKVYMDMLSTESNALKERSRSRSKEPKQPKVVDNSQQSGNNKEQRTAKEKEKSRNHYKARKSQK